MPDVLLAGGEGRVPLATVLLWHPCKVADAADVHDRGDCSLLLVLVGRAVGNRLDRHTVSLADLEVIGRRIVVGSHRDRKPRAIGTALFSHQDCTSKMENRGCRPGAVTTGRSRP